MKSAALLGIACLSVVWAPGALAADPPQSAKPTAYQYQAVTVAPPRVQGAVTAAGIRWQCSPSGCTTTGPWPVPGVSACQALAKQVGEIRAYGHAGRQLAKQDLASCNSVLAATQPKESPVPPNRRLQPTPAGVPAANARIDSGQLRGLTLRTEHYASLARIRAEAEAEARRRQEAEAERRRRANTKYGEDCDDTRRDVHPGAAEICDGRDNNCDGLVDEGQTMRRYLDADGDGHGNPTRALDVCPADVTNAARSAESLGGGWLVEVGNDCDDNDPARWRDCP